jgi:tRNA (guanine-N7-)-methyltransferase
MSDFMSPNNLIYPKREILSFCRREGRITHARKEGLKTLWPCYGLNLEDEGTLDWKDVFGREAPITLEIGFGDGRSLLQTASVHPERDFVGIDVYRAGVSAVISHIHTQKLSNIKLFCEDAVAVLAKKIPDNSLETVQIFFPDPWPKKKHHKRRLIQPDFVALVAQKLAPKGMLHLATDWEHYALHMMSVLSAASAFENTAGEGIYCTRPDARPYTKYEKRGIGLGHQTWDLMFSKK